MAKTVEIPDEFHEQVEARARERGLSVDEYVAHVLDVAPERDRTPAEVLERIRNRQPVDLGISAAELIREGREERTRQLTDTWLSSTPQR
jgi:hypothetical protein